ncbi:MAG: sigma-70 family RNA polymerase sigma factor [Fuerstiella sp.]
MSHDESDSAEWLQRLVDGDETVVAEFVTAFQPALERIASDRMSPGLQRRIGADDVFQSVCRTFFRRAHSGQFTLPDRESLWRLLCAITLNKVRLHARFQSARKRGSLRDASDVNAETAATPDHSISPEEAVAFADELAVLIETLGEAEGRLIRLKMEGYSHAEIAEQLNCTERTVGRLLVKIQQSLSRMMTVPD